MVTWRHRAIALLGRLVCDRGDDERAWECVRLLLPGGPHTEPGTTTFNRAVDLHLVAVDLSLYAGETKRARAWLESLGRWLKWSGARRWHSESRLGWAGLMLSTGDVNGAYSHAVEALRHAEQPRQPLALVAAYRMLGHVKMARGRNVDAGEHLRASLALADACAAPFERAQTLVSLAEASLSDGDVARSMLEEARDEFERLGARRALERTVTLLDALARVSGEPSLNFGLSKRELEVLRLVAQGMTDAQIAEQLFISYRTVTTHLSSIFNKLGVSSRVSATRIAVEHDLL
jgi:DNA-binding CsgD family transcriptional regulator